MQTLSRWENTLTFFPQFRAALSEHVGSSATVVVIGASDGRLVLPLAAAGHRVIAIERDPVALQGGLVQLPDGTEAHAAGLVERLQQEQLDDRVDIVEADFLDGDLPLAARYDAVWTSCSWHYSANHHRPLADFVTRMQDLVRVDGLFGAEFMMPVTARHHLSEHYTSPERLSPYFSDGWNIQLTLRTGQFTELPHIGQPHPHVHRMGALLATRTSSVTTERA
ncbi:SAM-dependent methyltransferase [Actinacidiphila sp. DG2A-62]|uniref:class I SAM-dependent methyltransferase n=1 Tax=Actinacidiphila sp. DG2A-62 TaxID=3108821 RepID=UPI002DBDC3C1|nr:SAM-dependent methyltransferase [Actinacidiphila sp. DG2A-62]MEC3995320.1 SAM-dependent methyltransferase [Actinacidiphila sp. DG2A-62]